MPITEADVRERFLTAAEQQLAASEDGELSTRAVCSAVGVTQPVLYRVFGDKKGLLDALAERGLERYARRKQSLEVTDDPVADLVAGWDDHMAFAAQEPHLYRLVFSPRPGVHAAARAGVHALLVATLERCASVGALRVGVEVAAAMILSANVGLATNRLAEPDVYGAAEVSAGLRDAVFDAVLAAPADRADDAPLAATSRQLAAQIRVDPSTPLAPEERALLAVWLDRLAEQPAAAPH